MSLLVNVYVRDENGQMSFIEPEHPSQELVGFESYRQVLYGSHAAISLGLTLLPSLATGDVYAQGDDLAHLRSDAERALSNIELFESEAGVEAERLRPRFENILRAVGMAEGVGGGGVIW